VGGDGGFGPAGMAGDGRGSTRGVGMVTVRPGRPWAIKARRGDALFIKAEPS
jgi:hypothetical protein